MSNRIINDLYFFFLTFLAGGWEHRNWHKGKLEELVRMREELGR